MSEVCKRFRQRVLCWNITIMCKKLLQGVRRSRAHVELVKNPREASDDNIAFVIVNPEGSILIS